MPDADGRRPVTDPDIDLREPGQRAELRRAPWTTLGAISAGGACGALARYGVAEAFGHPPGAFAWATLIVNVTGCLLIGALMVAITEVWDAHRLARPFLGVGVLGGYTTFSTYVVDAQRAVEAGSPGTALVYLAVTPVGALVAVFAGVRLARFLARSMGVTSGREEA
ncbi:fluoride efflux transporter FluC [Actinomadura sp. 9N407]|uniref:fluoride efflux transporter FluC n=1 Tax=Actinomadura sp. 9N407 TaxID=3375154 RepID=UPI0037A854E0